MGAIQLTPREKQFKGLLLDVAAQIDRDRLRERPSSEPIVLRWAGGWVRDKLLGRDSVDIDVAVNCMTGETFTEGLLRYCNEPSNAEKHSISPGDVGSLHKVAKNPDKSKHLETMAVNLFGIDVDFVNLRKETYTEISRNPQMEFGTAEEDALRRDASVNALFYNLHTGEVEDFVEGLPDLEAKLIRTPMEPLQTFLDDPLRVLRLVRFASRLGFTIDPGTEKMMEDERVHSAFMEKITRERVGIELEKMLKGKHPRDALYIIDKLGLYGIIFSDPTRENLPTPDVSRWGLAYECLDHLAATKTPGSIYDVLVRSEEDALFAWQLVSILPWEALALPEVPGKGTHSVPLATLAAREGIRATNKLCDIMTALHRNRPGIEALKKAVCGGEACIWERDRFGMAVRAWDTRTGNWRLQVLASALLEVMQHSEPGSADSRDKVLAGWQKFLDHLQELDVLDAPQIKRLIDGKRLSEALGVKPGKWMTPAMDVCMAWQLRNPGVTDVSGAIQEVRRMAGELGIPGLPDAGQNPG